MPSLTPSAPGTCPAHGGLGAARGRYPLLKSRADLADLNSAGRATCQEDPMNEQTLPVSPREANIQPFPFPTCAYDLGKVPEKA